MQEQYIQQIVTGNFLKPNSFSNTCMVVKAFQCFLWSTWNSTNLYMPDYSIVFCKMLIKKCKMDKRNSFIESLWKLLFIYLFLHSFIWLLSNKTTASILYLPPKPGCFICPHLHSSNPLLIKSNKHSSQFPFPISVSVSQSFNNIWKYMLAQKKGEHWGNRYFHNWNWDALFTASAIGLKILQFILISTWLNLIILLLSCVFIFGIFYKFWHLACTQVFYFLQLKLSVPFESVRKRLSWLFNTIDTVLCLKLSGN